MNGYVYFIACSETNRVKIGFTSGDPLARLRNLQTGSAGLLRLMAAMPGDVALERYLHEKFADCRLHGEWFDPSDDLIEHMMSVVWVEAAKCAQLGMTPPLWALIGLRTMSDTMGPLPNYLAVLIEEGETLQ